MTKHRAGLFSFEARGTVGGLITYQHESNRDYARRKPIPTDPQTDLQLWHRSLYLVVCQYWNGLTTAQKQVWESNARPYHITGFNLFMRTELAKLSSLRTYYPFAEAQGDSIADFSSRRNHLTRYGASWVTGKFYYALSFDGIDDHGDSSDAGLPSGSSQRSISCWLKIPTPVGSGHVYGYGSWTPNAFFGLTFPDTRRLHIVCHTNNYNFTDFYDANVWLFVTVTLDSSQYVHLFVNGVEDSGSPKSAPLLNTVLGGKLSLGNAPQPAASNPSKCILDEFHIEDTAITLAEHTIRYNRKETP